MSKCFIFVVTTALHKNRINERAKAAKYTKKKDWEKKTGKFTGN